MPTKAEKIEIVKKFMSGDMSIEQVQDYENSLPYDEAITFHKTMELFLFIAKKIHDKQKADHE